MSTPRRDAPAVVVQAAMGDYRQRFLDALASAEGFPVLFLVGTDYFDGTTVTRVDSAIAEVRPRNRFLARRRLLWQHGVVRRAVAAPVCVVEYNTRILSNWVIVVARRVLGRPTAVWGHAWSRRGREARTEPLRRVMRRLARNVLAYTYGQGGELATADPHVRVFVVPNSLYPAAAMVPVTGAARDVVYVGRLVPEKRPELLVEAWAKYAAAEPEGRLVVVGDGPLREPLRRQAEELGIADRVELPGHVADLAALRGYYEDALCSASPGYVGLSATQSLGFGVPFVYGDREPHAPEAELLDAANSVAFSAGDAADLAHVLATVRADAERWRGCRAAISGATRERYSSDAMAQGMIDAVRTIRGR